jgi:hypothetical protein
MLFLAGENPFHQEMRISRGLWISSQKKNTINIQIPDGYAIEKVPDPAVITMMIWVVLHSLQMVGSQIQISI